MKPFVSAVLQCCDAYEKNRLQFSDKPPSVNRIGVFYLHKVFTAWKTCEEVCW